MGGAASGIVDVGSSAVDAVTDTAGGAIAAVSGGGRTREIEKEPAYNDASVITATRLGIEGREVLQPGPAAAQGTQYTQHSGPANARAHRDACLAMGGKFRAYDPIGNKPMECDISSSAYVCPKDFPNLKEWETSGQYWCYNDAGTGCNVKAETPAPDGGGWGYNKNFKTCDIGREWEKAAKYVFVKGKFIPHKFQLSSGAAMYVAEPLDVGISDEHATADKQSLDYWAAIGDGAAAAAGPASKGVSDTLLFLKKVQGNVDAGGKCVHVSGDKSLGDCTAMQTEVECEKLDDNPPGGSKDLDCSWEPECSNYGPLYKAANRSVGGGLCRGSSSKGSRDAFEAECNGYYGRWLDDQHWSCQFSSIKPEEYVKEICSDAKWNINRCTANVSRYIETGLVPERQQDIQFFDKINEHYENVKKQASDASKRTASATKIKPSGACVYVSGDKTVGDCSAMKNEYACEDLDNSKDLNCSWVRKEKQRRGHTFSRRCSTNTAGCRPYSDWAGMAVDGQVEWLDLDDALKKCQKNVKCKAVASEVDGQAWMQITKSSKNIKNDCQGHHTSIAPDGQQWGDRGCWPPMHVWDRDHGDYDPSAAKAQTVAGLKNIKSTKTRSDITAGTIKIKPKTVRVKGKLPSKRFG